MLSVCLSASFKHCREKCELLLGFFSFQLAADSIAHIYIHLMAVHLVMEYPWLRKLLPVASSLLILQFLMHERKMVEWKMRKES